MENAMRILVTGSKGTLGQSVKEIFKDHDLILTDKETLDVTNYEQVMSYKDCGAEWIIHLAAMTNHYECEQNPQKTYMVNTIGTSHLCTLAKIINARMVYIGTGGMYDGNNYQAYRNVDMYGDKSFEQVKGSYPYTESSYPMPMNHYSRSKWYGEKLLLPSMIGIIIMRAGWLFGSGKKDKKFIGQIYAQIKDGKDIYAITDVYGTPTYAIDFAKYMLELIDRDAYTGIYNFSNDMVSRYDVAKEFVRLLGDPVEVIPVTYDEYHEMFPLKVPYTKCEAINTWRIVNIRNWKDALAEYVRRCFS